MKRERNRKSLRRSMGALLSLALAAGSLSALPAAAASLPEPPTGLPEPVKVFDFDGYQAGDEVSKLTQDGWTLNENANTYLSIASADADTGNQAADGTEHGRYLKFTSPESLTANSGTALYRELAQAGEKGLVAPDKDFTVTWDAYYEQTVGTSSQAILSFCGTPNNYNGYITKVQNGALKYQSVTENANTVKDAAAITYNTWHRLALLYDSAAKTGRLFIDGLDTGVQVLSRAETAPEWLYLEFIYNAAAESNLRIDNIAVYDQKLYPDSLYAWTDFESGIYQTGALPPKTNTGWYESNGSGHIQVAAAQAETPNRYLELNAAEIGSNNAITYFVFRGKRPNNDTSYTKMPADGDFTIAWDVYFEGEGQKGFDIAVVNESANKGLVTRYINTTGTFGVNSAGANANAVIDRTLQLSRGRWHHMAMAYTEDSRTARVYIDGVDIGHVCSNSMNQANKPVAVFFKANGDTDGVDAGTTAVMRIDNIGVYQGILDGLQTVTQPQLTLEQGEGTASARALVDMALGEETLLILAQYGEDEQLIQVKTASRRAEIPIEDNPENHGYNELTVTDDLDENAKSVKAFLWNSSQGMVPYCQGLQADAAASLAD